MANLTKNIGYYVYSLTDPRDNSVFYIGKGRGNRCNAHALKVKRKGPSASAKDKKIFEIQSSGMDVCVSITHSHLGEQEALDIEAMEIESHGIENLTNVMSKGSKGATDRAGVGVGRELVNTWLEMPDARRNIKSVELEYITPQFLHSCMCDVLDSLMRSPRSKMVIDGISSAIEEKYTGRHSLIG